MTSFPLSDVADVPRTSPARRGVCGVPVDTNLSMVHDTGAALAGGWSARHG